MKEQASLIKFKGHSIIRTQYTTAPMICYENAIFDLFKQIESLKHVR